MTDHDLVKMVLPRAVAEPMHEQFRNVRDDTTSMGVRFELTVTGCAQAREAAAHPLEPFAPRETLAEPDDAAPEPKVSPDYHAEWRVRSSETVELLREIRDRLPAKAQTFTTGWIDVPGESCTAAWVDTQGKASIVGMPAEPAPMEHRTDALVYGQFDARKHAEPAPVPPMPEGTLEERTLSLHVIEKQRAERAGLTGVEDLSASEVHARLAQGWHVDCTSPAEWSHFHRTFPASRYAPVEPLPEEPWLVELRRYARERGYWTCSGEMAVRAVAYIDALRARAGVRS